MKKVTTSFLLILLLGFCLPGFAQSTKSGEVFSENFDKFEKGKPNAGADPSDVTATLDNLTNQPGWSGVKVYQAGGAIKMGGSSALGSITTPAVDLSANGGRFTLSFRAMAWNNDAKTLKIYLNDQLQDVTMQEMGNTTEYVFTDYSFDLSGGTASSKITFEGLQASKGRFFLDDLVITQGGAAPAVEAPAIAPIETVFETTATVSITCITADTKIYYTLDDSEPTAASMEYTAPFELTKTTTVKAIAIKGADNSKVSEKTYVKTLINSIAELRKSPAGLTIYTLNVKDVVTTAFLTATNKLNLYVQDNEAGILIFEYKPTFVTGTFAEGDHLTGTIKGTLTLYNGLLEFIPSEFNVTVSSNSGKVKPISLKLAELLANYETYNSRLVQITNVLFDAEVFDEKTNSVNASAGDDKIVVRNSFGQAIETLPSYEVDIIGVASTYNTPQLAVRTASDIVKAGTGLSSTATDKNFDVIGLRGEAVINSAEAVQVFIYGVNGQLIQRVMVQEGETTLSIPAGAYVINGLKAIVL